MKVFGHIHEAFKTAFRESCLELVCMAHRELMDKHTVTRDSDEETVSSCIYAIIREHPKAIENSVHVNIEHRLLPAHYADAPSASKMLPRIDFHFERDAFIEQPVRYSYYMEAKNLYEHNFRKSDNSSMTNALSVQKRYIETGINHIVSGYYPPETMMVGYVLEGGIAPIVSAINSILGDSSSRLVATPHKLTVAKGQELYSSRHESLDIRHLLLQF